MRGGGCERGNEQQQAQDGEGRLAHGGRTMLYNRTKQRKGDERMRQKALGVDVSCAPGATNR